MRRDPIGTVICHDAANPVPQTTGWSITEGRSYTVLRRFTSDEGVQWLTIIGDDGKNGNYKASRFDTIEPAKGGAPG